MATQQATVDALLDGLTGFTAKKMFGEYSIYSGNKVIALVADEMLFIKPSSASETFAHVTTEAPPYPGAKLYHMVPDGLLKDKEWLQTIFDDTSSALPEPKPKAKKKS